MSTENAVPKPSEAQKSPAEAPKSPAVVAKATSTKAKIKPLPTADPQKQLDALPLPGQQKPDAPAPAQKPGQ